jgi:hypothetical protein
MILGNVVFDKNFRTRPKQGTQLVFKIFRSSDDFIMQKVYLLMLMSVGWPNNVSGLIFSVRL